MNENDYRLYHHGILGQKWGVRRYQNEDGTLTEAGKKRQKRRDTINKAVTYPIKVRDKYSNVYDSAKTNSAKDIVKRGVTYPAHLSKEFSDLSDRISDKASKKTENAVNKLVEGSERKREERAEKREQVAAKREQARQEREDRGSKAMSEARSKNVNELSTKEIKDYNDRLRAEAEFNKLTQNRGKQYVTKTATTVGTAILTGVLISAGTTYANKYGGMAVKKVTSVIHKS